MIRPDRRSALALIGFAAAGGIGSAFAAIGPGTAVVLIHGKAGGQGPLQPLATALRREGVAVSLPAMSWRSRYRTYEQTLGEVAAHVAAARRRGASKVILAGHSLGANISLGYAAMAGDISGVVAMAPGHRPDFIATATGDALARARQMMAAGQGRQNASFLDFNHGRTYPITTTAEAYLSFFDPGGPAARAAAASGVRVPVLWVIGTGDRPAMRDRAPYATGSRIEVNADRQRTPVVAVQQIVQWIAQR